jgi:hypothetical protein
MREGAMNQQANSDPERLRKSRFLGFADGNAGLHPCPPKDAVLNLRGDVVQINDAPTDVHREYWNGYDEGVKAPPGALNPHQAKDAPR